MSQIFQVSTVKPIQGVPNVPGFIGKPKGLNTKDETVKTTENCDGSKVGSRYSNLMACIMI